MKFVTRSELLDWFKRAPAPFNWVYNGIVGATILINGVTTELRLYSSQTGSPYANTFIRFLEPDGTTKGVVGFTASGDNTFSITSYEDFRLKLRTGKPGDPTSFVNRANVYGTATVSYITIISANTATEIGGCYLRFTESDDSIPKGYVGYASTTNDNLSIINTVSGGHVTLEATGTGRVRPNVPLEAMAGSVTDPSITFQGDEDTGFYSDGPNSVGYTAAGTLRQMWETSRTYLRMQIQGQDGSVGAPAYSYENDSDTGIYRIDPNHFGVAVGGAKSFEFRPSGAVRFVPLATDPASLQEGDVWYNSTDQKLRLRLSASTVDLN